MKSESIKQNILPLQNNILIYSAVIQLSNANSVYPIFEIISADQYAMTIYKIMYDFKAYEQDTLDLLPYMQFRKHSIGRHCRNTWKYVMTMIQNQNLPNDIISRHR